MSEKKRGRTEVGGMKSDEMGTEFLFNSVGGHHLFTLEIWEPLDKQGFAQA